MHQLKFLCSVMHDLGLKTPGVTACLARAVRSIFWCANQCIGVDDWIQFLMTIIVSANSDATDIGHQPNSMNWEDDLYLTWSCKSLLYS